MWLGGQRGAVYFMLKYSWNRRIILLERLVKEYMDLLDGAENASDKFWKLEERIKEDKKHPGVMLELSKGNMIFDIVALINSDVIITADLADFSDELKESVDFLLSR